MTHGSKTACIPSTGLQHRKCECCYLSACTRQHTRTWLLTCKTRQSLWRCLYSVSGGIIDTVALVGVYNSNNNFRMYWKCIFFRIRVSLVKYNAWSSRFGFHNIFLKCCSETYLWLTTPDGLAMRHTAHPFTVGVTLNRFHATQGVTLCTRVVSNATVAEVVRCYLAVSRNFRFVAVHRRAWEAACM